MDIKKTLLLGVMALPAAIASMSQPTVAVAQSASNTWTGVYAGANAGGAWGTSAQHDDGFTITTLCTINCGTVADGRYHISGPVVGGGFGYNWQNGPWVAGFETDLSWADVKGHSDVCLPAPGHECGTKVESLGTVRGRLGMVYGGSPAYSGMPTKVAPVATRGTLVYLTGGFAYGRVHGWDLLTPVSGTKTYTGWTVGAGVEWALQGNWSAKLEYLYVDLGKKELFDVVPGVPETVSAKLNVVRFGLNYKFDSGGNSWGKGPISAKY
jgi:outer membrane immunogenic protein